MKKAPVFALVLGLMVDAVPPGPVSAAPVPGPQDAAPPVFGVESSVVLLDVVVRDKKGRLVKDLKEADFEVFEDGQKQDLTSFRVFDRMQDGVRVSTPSSPGTPTATATPSVAPPPTAPEDQRSPVVLAFVFDRMSTEGLANAHKAAKAYAIRGHVEGDLVGIFAIDLALRTLQPFTTDIEAVRTAIDKVGLQARTPFAENRDKTRELNAQVDRADQILGNLSTSGVQQDGATSAFAASVGVERVFANMQARMLNSFDRLERDQQGFSSTNGLSAMVSGLKALPGRKTIVFFSEGISITTSVLAQFRGVVAAANRANVAVYAIEAGGLRVESDLKESRADLVQTSKDRLAQEARGGAGTDGPMMRGIEQVEDRLRSSPKAGLGQLAEDTGGFLIADTNDASKGFERIQEEMRFYYVLAYSPSDSRFDGRFRNLSVKVARPGAVVFSRKGYFAVPPDAILPVRPIEAPVLAELGRKPAPSDLPLSALALSFPELKRPGRVPVMMHMPLAGIQFDADKDQKVYRASFTMLARLLDATGQEVDRMSREYPVSVPATSLDAAQKGDVFFFQETDLPPGRYTLETAVLDALSKKAAVRRAPLDVPEVAEGQIRMSDLVVLRSVEKLGAEEIGRDNPLYVGDTILYPNMGEAVEKSKNPALGFFFATYVPPGLVAPKQASMEIMKGGTSLARLPVGLGAPNGDGRIQTAARLPIQALEPGEYGLRVSVTSGETTTSQNARFVIAN